MAGETPRTSEIMSDEAIRSPIIGPIYSRRKAGFLDWSGEWVIEPKYKSLGELSDGLISFVEDGKLGFLGESGNVMIPARFDVERNSESVRFHEGLAAVSENSATGYINRKGDWAIAPTPDSDAWDFYEGKAIFGLQGYAVIDATGTKLSRLDAWDMHIQSAKQHPRSWDWIVCLFRMQEGFKVGVLDWRGQSVLPPIYEELGEIHQGVAAFAVETQEGPFGLLNRSGEVIKSPVFRHISPFSDGVASAYVHEKQVGYINTSGEFVIEPKFQQACSFDEGLACVTVKVPKGQRVNKGFINLKGELVIEPAFRSQTGFRGGWAHVDMDGKHGVIDRTGKLIWEEPLEFDLKSRCWV
jgi:hypothetical protein